MYHTITITPSRVCGGGGSILNFDIFYKETCLFFIFYHEKHFYPEAYEDAALTPAPMCIILLTCTRAKLPPIIFHFSEVLSIFPIWAWKKTNKIKLQDLWIFNLGNLIFNDVSIMTILFVEENKSAWRKPLSCNTSLTNLIT